MTTTEERIARNMHWQKKIMKPVSDELLANRNQIQIPLALTIHNGVNYY